MIETRFSGIFNLKWPKRNGHASQPSSTGTPSPTPGTPADTFRNFSSLSQEEKNIRLSQEITKVGFYNTDETINRIVRMIQQGAKTDVPVFIQDANWQRRGAGIDYTCFTQAVKTGYLDLVKAMAKAMQETSQGDINAKDPRHQDKTAVELAASSAEYPSQIEVVRWLLDNGATFNPETILFEDMRPEVADLFVQRGAKLDSRLPVSDIDFETVGFTPLMFHADAYNKAMVRYLAEQQPSLLQDIDEKGRTAYQIIQERIEELETGGWSESVVPGLKAEYQSMLALLKQLGGTPDA